VVAWCHSESLASVRIWSGDTCPALLLLIACRLKYSIVGKVTVEVEENFVYYYHDSVSKEVISGISVGNWDF